jgi:hemolysin D
MNAVAKTSDKAADLIKNAVRVDRRYAEFLPAAVEISARPVPRIVPVILITLILLIFGALLWSYFFTLAVYTNAAGRVRSTVPTTVVQPMEAGRVTEILAKNDQAVKTGETLIVLDNVELAATLEATMAATHSWNAELIRRRTAYEAISKSAFEASQPVFPSQIPPQVAIREQNAFTADINIIRSNVLALAAQRREAEARRDRFQQVANAQKSLIAILNEKTIMLEGLVVAGSASRGALLNSKESEARALSDLMENLAQTKEIDATLDNFDEMERHAKATFVSQQSQGIQAAERQLEQLDQEAIKLRARIENRTLRAPVDGVVQQLAITGLGQVVNPGQTLMAVVPNDTVLVVDALIPSSEIGFVKEGQTVTLKADAFPFTRYGTFTGKVISLSDDAVRLDSALALQDPLATGSGQTNIAGTGLPNVENLFFVAHIGIDNPDIPVGNGNISLENGMTVRAEIETETRRIIDYILSPVTAVLSEAGHER